MEARERRARAARSPAIADRYDFMFIDCPPSLGLLTVNALTAADAVLIPLQCEYYALEGLTQLLATIDLVRDHLNPGLAINGRRADHVRRPDEPVRRRRRRGPTPPRRTRLSRRSSRAASGSPRPRATASRSRSYAPDSRGADAYRALAEEFRALATVGRAPRDRQLRPRTVGTTLADRVEARWRHDRPPGAPAGPRPRASRRSSRNARAATRRRSRSRSTGSAPTRISRASASTRRASPRSTASIAEHGIIQPILVTETIDGYQLVAGERRLRAAQRGRAGADPGGRPPARRPRPARARPRREPPARGPRPDRGRPRRTASSSTSSASPRSSSPRGSAERDRPSPTRSGCSSSRRASRLRSPRAGSPRATRRALGGLAPDARTRSSTRSIGPGPVGPPDRGARPPPARTEDRPIGAAATARTADPDLERVEEELRQALGTKVRVARSRQGGRIVIEYYSDEELGRLYERLTGGTA